ncbi:MAG: hypothetical protein BAJALOKI3v1_960006 [Promethearchaeota archaeon]|nr:MAG: hypothetical protein BAJALOKI3v1_960006 [Candidatus Lokiarchaeota archaeon]
MKSFVGNLNKFLEIVLEKYSEVNSAFIVNNEGMPIASTSKLDTDIVKVAAIITVIQFLSKNLIQEMNMGFFDQVNIHYAKGWLILKQLGPSVILAISSSQELALNFLFLEKSENLTQEFKAGYQKIKSLMKEKKLSTLTIDKIYLSEIFDEKTLEISRNGYPKLKWFYRQFLLFGGIAVKYDGKTVKFIEIF